MKQRSNNNNNNNNNNNSSNNNNSGTEEKRVVVVGQQATYATKTIPRAPPSTQFLYTSPNGYHPYGAQQLSINATTICTTQSTEDDTTNNSDEEADEALLLGQQHLLFQSPMQRARRTNGAMTMTTTTTTTSSRNSFLSSSSSSSAAVSSSSILSPTASLNGLHQNGKIISKQQQQKKSSRRSTWRSLYHRWIRVFFSSFSSLLLAVILWYTLGVLCIGTSKLLLMSHEEHSQEVHRNVEQEEQHHNNNHPHHYYSTTFHRHHHPLIGGVPPLFFTLQQLIIGSCWLRFLLHIRFLGSPGLAPWPTAPDPRQRQRQRYHYAVPPHTTGRPTTSSSSSSSYYEWLWWVVSAPVKIHSQLLATGLYFAVGFLMTNYGFSGSSASFVETIKAAEPITSATVAVAWGIEVLGRKEMMSLLAIVVGVVLSTLANSSSSAPAAAAADATIGNHHHHDSSWSSLSSSSSSHHNVLMESFRACAIVMVSNLSFSFRGLYQKLFRMNPEGSIQLVDDLNLQLRMQQIGIVLLILPVVMWDMIGILRHLSTLQQVHGLWSSGVTSRYIGLSLLNGTCFTGYNLASTYILSRISVVHHAALNCVRRVFAIVITSIYFVIPITVWGSFGIVTSLGGFMAFTHYKVKRQRQPNL